MARRTEPRQRERPVALVTGGGHGIGGAIARALAADFRIVVFDRSGAADETAHDLCAEGHESRALRLDICDEPAAGHLPDRLGAWWSNPAVPVNTAALSSKTDGIRRPIADRRVVVAAP